MLKVVGIAVGSMSLAILAWHGFNLTLGPSLTEWFGFYETRLSAIFRFVEPAAKYVVDVLAGVFDYRFELYPHWKHSFVLLWLYFGSWVKQAWQVGNKGSAVFQLVWGGIVAFGFGVISGLFPLDSGIKFAIWPIIGFLLYEIGWNFWYATYFRKTGVTWWRSLIDGVNWTLTRFGIPSAFALVFAALVATTKTYEGLPNPFLALLFILLLSASFFWMWQALLQTRQKVGIAWPIALRNKQFWQSVLANGKAILSLNILYVLGGAVVMLLVGASGI